MDLNCWMNNIDDTTQVLKMNIAGTHDCVTKYVQLSHISKCQNKNIYEQLELGIRALDIRVKNKGSRLKMIHGLAKAFNTNNHFSQWMDMQDVLEQCYRFLDNNPSETILFQFKNDCADKKEHPKSFDNLFNTYISKNKDKWFLKNRAPMLKEARGKIILIRRCAMYQRPEYNDKNTGIDFSKWVEQDTKQTYPLELETSGENKMTFIVQDRFKYKPEPRWSLVIEPFLNTMSCFNGKYVINYLSTAGGLKGPYNNSKYINPQFMKYELKENYYYGTIYTDFPDEELVKKIIKSNKQYFKENTYDA